MNRSYTPLISVVIPFYNAAAYLERCLESVRDSRYTAYELLLVDDGSTDASPEIARRFCDRTITLPRSHGPAFARNRGAEQAAGEFLFFIDADVLCFPDTLGIVESMFRKNPEIAAVIGSYDDDPPERNFISQYKNLTHHFVHQSASSEASTFWTGCGAIRREVFLGMRGFDESYRRASIEDIELGYRLRAAGQTIRLCKTLTVRHAKRWSFGSLLRSDIRDRAIPWTILQLSHREILNDLNLTLSQRASAILLVIAVFCIFVGFWRPEAIALSGISLVAVLYWNRMLYRFYFERGGFWFCLGSTCMHWFYYVYSLASFVAGYLMYKLSNRELPSQAAWR